MSGCLNRTMLHLLIQKSKTSSNVIKAIVLFDGVKYFYNEKYLLKLALRQYIYQRENLSITKARIIH